MAIDFCPNAKLGVEGRFVRILHDALCVHHNRTDFCTQSPSTHNHTQKQNHSRRLNGHDATQGERALT